MSPRVASIGECMVELKERVDGTLSRSHGGDTLNTAIYLARLGVSVDYVTALGDDPWSDEMAAAWHAEGVGITLVRRVPGRLPGLYVIQTDAAGERSFTYWRDSAAARIVFDLPDAPALIETLAGYDLLYYSGITLSIYGETGRARLFAAIKAIRARGGRVAFDTNFRPRGWPDRDAARMLYREAFGHADFILASTEDLALLFGADGGPELRRHGAAAEIVLKLATPGVQVPFDGVETLVEAPPVANLVDTTAAGDSFAAAYLAARLRGATTIAAAQAGHRLAGLVVQYPGAIIPRSAMPTEVTP